MKKIREICGEKTNNNKEETMKSLYSIHRKACKLLLAAAALLPITSCDTVWDNDEDCPIEIEYRVKFKYDYNMLYADAFASQVHSVTLYAFDTDGKLVFQQTEQGEKLADTDYSMLLPLEAGNYRLVAWAGVQDGNAFTVPPLTEGFSTIDDLTCRINRYPATLHGEAIDSVGYLQPLWHGQLDMQTSARAADRTDYFTVPLVKNTNTFRIILQQMAAGAVDASDFEFTIADENGLMLSDNSLSPTNGMLTYMPYYQAQGSAGIDGPASEDQLNMAVAELTTGRLMADSDIRLTISSRETGETVLSIPLIDYLELCKTVANYDMPLQEYLDREDTYTMTFFLDSNNAWINTQVIINDWIVRYNDITPEI